MSVPSHNLYDFIHQVAEKKFLLMYFSPWGSREFENVINHLPDDANLSGPLGLDHILTRSFDKSKKYLPVILCHDQEPLNYDLHASENKVLEYVKKIPILSKMYPPYDDLNIAFKIYHSWQHKWVLLHSELNSTEISKYEATGHYVGAYWWSHALLARDWYRYAEHDLSLKFVAKDKRLFLIYSRDSTGSRKYRQIIVDLIKKNLNSESYQIGSFHGKNVGGDSSAGYESEDYVRTDISLVLETIADSRVHLTEKILRPIACGHPFILMAGPGSLKVLKNYGFETFSPWIDESYDCESDQFRRIKLIVEEMSRIENLPKDKKDLLLSKCREIAHKNQERFFSREFLDYVVQEMKQNISLASGITNGSVDYDLIDWMHARRDEIYPEWRNLLQQSFEQDQRHQHSLDDKSSTDGHNV